MGRPRTHGTWLLLSLPSLAVASVIVAVVVGLRERPVVLARLYGGPTTGQAGFSGRLLLEEELASVTRPLAEETVRVAWLGRASEREVLVKTGSDGFAEFSLAPPFEVDEGSVENVHLRVTHPRSGAVLLDGRPALSSRRWRESARRRGGQLRGAFKGPPLFEVRVVEGVLAAPFPGHIELRFADEVRTEGMSLNVSAEGASLQGERLRELHGERTLVLELAPLEHAASLSIVATPRSGTKTEYFSGLPVVPGASFFRLEGDRLRVMSALPRNYLWYTFVTLEERLSGGRVALEVLPNGTSIGTLALPARAGKDRFVVLSSEGDGRSPSTVGFPLDGPMATFDVVDGFLQDGSEEARLRETSRQRHLRMLLMVHVALVFLLTLTLSFLRVRSEGERMKQEFVEAGVETSRPTTGGYFGVAALCLTLGFSAALVWVSVGALP